MIPLAVWVARLYGEEMGGWPAMRGAAGAREFLATIEEEWKG